MYEIGQKIKFKHTRFKKGKFGKCATEGMIVGHKDNHGGQWRVEYDAPHEYNGVYISIHPTTYVDEEDIIKII